MKQSKEKQEMFGVIVKGQLKAEHLLGVYKVKVIDYFGKDKYRANIQLLFFFLPYLAPTCVIWKEVAEKTWLASVMKRSGAANLRRDEMSKGF